jgi:hypothetical protein
VLALLPPLLSKSLENSKCSNLSQGRGGEREREREGEREKRFQGTRE